MAASDFFARWAKPEAGIPDASNVLAAAPPASTESLHHDAEMVTSPLPSADDARALAPGAGIAAFMQSGVDEGARRLALKQLFADPHFNRMDGLDIYTGDYNTFMPISASLVASLNHAKALLADYVEPQLARSPAAPVSPFAPVATSPSLATAPAAIDDGGPQAADLPVDRIVDPTQAVLVSAPDAFDTIAAPHLESIPRVLPGL